MASHKTEGREKPRVRRTKAEMDPSILQRIVDIISVGASKQDACDVVGIHFSTLREWELRGEDGQEPFVGFAADMEAARANKKTYLVGLLHKAADDDWKAGAWLLERRYPAEYGRRLGVAAEVEHKAEPQDLSRLSVEELRQLSAIQAKLKGE